jgi:hypothetical protein
MASNRKPAKSASAGGGKRIASDTLYNFTSGRTGFPITYRVQLRTKAASRPQFTSAWYQGTQIGNDLDSQLDTKQITYDRLKDLITDFVEVIPADASGKKFVCDDINMSGSFIYVPEERPKELDSSSTKQWARPISSDIDLENAINKVAFVKVKAARDSRAGKIRGVVLDLLIFGKKLKTKTTSKPRNITLERSGDEDDDGSISMSQASKNKKASRRIEDKDVSFSFTLLPPTYLKPNKDKTIKEYVIHTDEAVLKDSIRMKSNGVRPISAAEVVKRIQDEAMDLVQYKDTNDNTLIPERPKLYYRHSVNSKKMLPISSTAELWQYINNKRRGDFMNDQVSAGKLFFSIGSRIVDSEKENHNGVSSPELQQKYTQEDHPTPAPLPQKKFANTVSAKRRTASWAVDCGEELEAFVLKLYRSPQSSLYHGFHAGHASIMTGHFKYHLKYGENKDLPIWEVFTCTDGDDSTWPEYEDLRLDFVKPVYDRLSAGVLPAKEQFQPNVEDPDNPPPAPKVKESKVSGIDKMAEGINLVGQAMLQATAARVNTPASAAFLSPMPVHHPSDVVVSFEFTRIDAFGNEYKCSAMVEDTKTQMKKVIKQAWDNDVLFPTGTFSGIDELDMKMIAGNDMELMFTIPKLGQQPKKAFGRLTVERVLAVVGPEVRPVPVKVDLVAALKPAANPIAMPSNLFGDDDD